MGIRKLLLLQLLWISSLFAVAQNGTIKGLVKDKNTNEPLVGATVVLEGTTTGTITDFDGNYTVENIKPGTYTLRCSFISYETKQIPNVQVKAGQSLTFNFDLGESTVEIEDVKVVAKANRESESMLLVQQKNAVLATQAIGAQEISRKGASDAEAAVTKVSGISKKEGENNVFVRGLGDRFNATLLNGFPVPSQDPEYKNISLDFFSSDIIKAVGVNKVFSASMSGDVGGAEININSKELVGEKDLGFSLSSGANSETISEKFLLADGVNTLGYGKRKAESSSLSVYDYPNSLDPGTQDFQLNRGFGFSGGKRLFIGADKKPLNFYIIGSYSTDYTYENGVLRETLTNANISRDVTTDKYEQNSSHLLMANVDFKLKKTALTYNGVYIHTSERFLGDYFGVDKDFFQDVADQGSKGLLRRQEVIDNSLLVNQINSISTLSDRSVLEAGLSYNMVTGSQPDRRQNYLSYQGNDILQLTLGSGYQLREFQELKENDLNGKLIFSYKITPPNEKNVLKIGYTGRYITDDFRSNTYDQSVQKGIDVPLDNVVLDNIFTQANLDNGTFRNFSYLQTYAVDKFINSAFGELTYGLAEKTTANLGLKADYVDFKISYNVNQGGNVGTNSYNYLYFLPSFNLKHDLNEKNSLRLGISRTYTLPQTKEMSPFRFNGRDFSSQGNPDLKPSVNINIDLKWDYYLGSDELISLTAFGKNIQDPISRIEVASAGGYLSYQNIADHATIGGFELELRKNIFKTMTEDGKGAKLSMGFNGSYIKTDVKLRKDLGYLSFTNEKSELEGAAPVIMNADLSYEINREKLSWTNSVVANYFSDRIYTIGTGTYQDINEDGVTTLDFISSAKFGKHFGLSLKAKNLLDPSYRLSRKPNVDGARPITIKEYKKGINFGAGISYTL
jgi:outer membrane receptor protein involved in Fe transport